MNIKGMYFETELGLVSVNDNSSHVLVQVLARTDQKGVIRLEWKDEAHLCVYLEKGKVEK